MISKDIQREIGGFLGMSIRGREWTPGRGYRARFFAAYYLSVGAAKEGMFPARHFLARYCSNWT
jgi:hypothetical protein